MPCDHEFLQHAILLERSENGIPSENNCRVGDVPAICRETVRRCDGLIVARAGSRNARKTVPRPGSRSPAPLLCKRFLKLKPRLILPWFGPGGSRSTLDRSLANTSDVEPNNPDGGRNRLMEKAYAACPGLAAFAPCTFAIWQAGSLCARLGGATTAVRAARNAAGFERAAEDSLGARE
jgi:hypothetical protein